MLSRMLGLGALLTGEVAAVVGLHLLGGLPWFALPAGDVGAWLTAFAPEDVIAALLRVAALGGAYWLVVSTVLYALARASRLPAAVGGAAWVTLPIVRRVADRAIAVTVATSLVGGSAPAALAGVGGAAPAELPGAPLTEEVVRGPESAVPFGQPLPPSLTPQSLPDPGSAEPAPAPAPGSGAPEGLADVPDAGASQAQPPGHVGVPDGRAGEPAGPGHAGVSGARAGEPGEASGGAHVVAPGDHLWAIAAADLAEDSPREASQLTPEEIAPHWREVVDGNRGQLRSGDPDVIFPGERIELPPEDR